MSVLVDLPSSVLDFEKGMVRPLGPIQHAEVCLMDFLSEKFDFRNVVDVGANIGCWSLLAHRRFKKAILHSFEVVPETYSYLIENIQTYKSPRIRPFCQGLSDKTGTLTINFAPEINTVSSILDNPFVGTRVIPTICKVITGDKYLQETGIPNLDFVKIDTDGMDLRVLKGFEGALKDRKISMIQFEYSWLSIFSHELLYDFYRYLSPFGFKIGKIMESGIAWKPYHHSDEDFKGPDYLAALEEFTL